ncbi:MAG: DUF4328 domain-containing protein [Nocardioidaceae bacterium]
MSVPADWYPDPQDARLLRWFDGTVWTEHVSPAPANGLDEEPRTVGSLGRTSVLLVALTATAQVLSAVLSPGADLTGTRFTAYGAVQLLCPLLLVGAGIVTCTWLSRARENAEILNPAAPHARSRGWVWGSWICPIVCVLYPFQLVRDVRRATNDGAKLGARPGLWWAGFLVFAFAGYAAARTSMTSDPAAAGSLQSLEWVAAVGAVVAATVWAGIVGSVDRGQRARIEALASSNARSTA